METLFVFALAVTVAAATPGPSLFALIARALGSGFWSTVPMALGMIAGEITLLILAVLGLVALAAQMGELFFAIRLLGAAYLFYLGWKQWRMPLGEMSPNCGYVKARFGDRPWRTALAGAAIALGNPKSILFYFALLSTFLDVSRLGAGDIGSLCLICLGVVSTVYGVYIAAAARARRMLSSALVHRRLNRGAGVLMIGAAGAIVTS